MKILLLPALLLGAICIHAQSTWYVNGSTATPGNGTSWNQSFQYLDDAFAAAADGDEIWVAAGTYIPGGTAPSVTSWYSPLANFRLYGGFQGMETDRAERNPQVFPVIINGDVAGDDVSGDLEVNSSDNLRHLMVLDTFITNATIIDGIRFTRGKTANASGSGDDRRGGGILSFGSPIIENCRFIENFGWFGGGAYPRGQYAVDFKIRNSIFTANGGGSGGAMYVVGGQTLEITNCTFDNGLVDNTGAALRIQDAENFLVNDCVFERNFSTGSGGAINFLRANGTVKNSVFERNGGNFGGALVNYTEGEVDIDSCLFEGNNSFASGAAISLAFESTTHITNSTFLENTAAASTGAIYIQGGESPGDSTTTATIRDCVFDLNDANSSSGAIWCRYSSVVSIDRSTFVDNLAINGAGAITVGPDSLNLGATAVSNSYFLFNTAGTQGGAIDVLNADLMVSNSVFNGNDATTYGGGIIVNGADSLTASALIVNCTFSDNNGDLGGNEIGAFSDGSDTTNVLIQNSIFYNDDVIYSTEAGSPSVVSLGGNVYSTSAPDSIFTLSTDLAVTDPDLIFVDTRDDLSLLATSPAINAGISNANTPAMDILGFVRDAMPDAGAFEFDTTSSVYEANSGIRAYAISPNPARDVVQLTFNLEDQRLLESTASIEIYDLKGTLLFEQAIRIAGDQNTYTLNTSRLISGNYIVQLLTEMGVSSATLIKM